jgi:RNA polymerase sigma-70 factor (ECF subfamily)
MDELHTTSLRDLIARFRADENSALDSLIRRTQERLEQFARRMLGGFPGVRAREQVEDILQNALIRLTRALRQEMPSSVGEFFGLAALHLRRELLDLARSHTRRPTAHLAKDPPEQAGDTPNELDRWAALHEAAGRLPDQLRQVFACTSIIGDVPTAAALPEPWTRDQLELDALNNYYVANANSNSVLRYKIVNGAFIDTFASGGGLTSPFDLVFGPDLNLYVTSDPNSVLR